MSDEITDINYATKFEGDKCENQIHTLTFKTGNTKLTIVEILLKLAKYYDDRRS